MNHVIVVERKNELIKLITAKVQRKEDKKDDEMSSTFKKSI